MSAFIFIASSMVLAALAILWWPLWKSVPADGRRWPALGITALALPALAFGLYLSLSNWSWKPDAGAAGVPPEVEQMVARLEARMQSSPRDVDGWLLLGRSYFQLNRFFKAADAYQQAYTLTQGKNAEAVLGLGEALAFADEHSLTGRSGELFDAAMQLDPNNPKALWYSGLAAYQRGQLEIARTRWSQLVALSPPPEVKRVLQTKIDEISQQLGNVPAAPAGGAAAADNAAVVQVHVSVAQALAAKVPPKSPLFVMVRTGEGGGPPLAVTRRNSDELPLLVELSDKDAMVAGRTLSGASRVSVVARVSHSGDPRAQSGDLQGQVSYDVGKSGTVELVIDSILP